jgi:hypothetical protein
VIEIVSAVTDCPRVPTEMSKISTDDRRETPDVPDTDSCTGGSEDETGA